MSGYKVRFFESAEEELFNTLLKKLPGCDPGGVIVQPLGRIGFSGAKVFTFFAKGEYSLPFVGKIHSPEGIARELEGIDRAFGVYTDAYTRLFDVIGEKRAIVATPLIGRVVDGQNQPRVTELYDLLFSRNKEIDDPVAGKDSWYETSTEILIERFSHLYSETCRSATLRAKLTCDPIELEEEYKWYLRKDETRPRMKTWLESQGSNGDIQLGGEKYPNPLTYVDALRQKKINAVCSTVHGDLHPMNVLLDGNEVLHLIDFTWCQENAHILKDFLVMECSIRFLMMPTHLGPQSQRILDQGLLEPSDDKTKEMIAELRKAGVDDATLLHIERCARIMVCLRGFAEKACGGHFRLADYLACQAIVLYGLMSIERYPFDHCARSLAIICGHLHKSAYV